MDYVAGSVDGLDGGEVEVRIEGWNWRLGLTESGYASRRRADCSRYSWEVVR